MGRAEAISRLKTFEPRLRALGATSLFLFGSTARDEATEASDLDIVLEVPGDTSFTLLDLVAAKHMVEDDLRMAVDVAMSDGLHPLMKDEIEHEAVKIF